jgi:hypothetical protein
MVFAVSTSHPYGDRLAVKNCTEPYRKNPTRHSSNALRYYISEYYGEIFLHFLLGMLLIQKICHRKENTFLK